MARFRFRVSEQEAGERLDRVLASRPEIASRALAERLIASGDVLVAGASRPKSHRLALADDVEVRLEDARPLQAEDLDLTLAYEDEHLLVVDKPAGVVVHPAGSTQTGTVAHGVLALGAAGGEDSRPGLVHRLDRDTSGLLLVARSEEVHRRLQNALRRRDVERRYLALVVGEPRSRTGRIEAPIGRDRRDRTRHSLDTANPRDAVTWFELREPLPGRALLELRLETGRTHQIRVHLEAIGLPVSGDPVYGVAGDLGLERQFLHAHRLQLRHPLTGAVLDVSSPLPAELAAALERARDAA
ncbi:MAG TPA: RluA family pseudouridine synthase [Gaiellaceae bacterium]|nr:RluA family pseudouridine synthase [Gaiellaceae bacterium]